jgi:hypothetical protein
MMRLRIHPDVETETEAAARWYEARQLGLGFDYLSEVDAVIQKIRDSPHSGTRLETLPDESGMFRIQLKRFRTSSCMNMTLPRSSSLQSPIQVVSRTTGSSVATEIAAPGTRLLDPLS